MTPVGMKELLSLSRVQVLCDVHYVGRPMDEDQCFQALRELTRFIDGVEMTVER